MLLTLFIFLLLLLKDKSRLSVVNNHRTISTISGILPFDLSNRANSFSEYTVKIQDGGKKTGSKH